MQLRKITVLLILLSGSFHAVGQRYTRAINKARNLYSLKNYVDANKEFKRAFRVYSENSSDLYSAACAASLAGDTGTALKYLSLAFDKGYTDIEHVKNNPKLGALHRTEQWSQTLSNGSKTIQDNQRKFKNLKLALLKVYTEDQRIRYEHNSIMESSSNSPYRIDSIRNVMRVIDSIHVAFVTSSIDSNGWLGKNLVGNEASLAQFYVIQHSNPSIRNKFLPVLEEAVKRGDAEKVHLAYLTDRIAVETGRLQIYGTQFGENPQTRRLYVLPLFKPESVDKRRQEVFMPPIADDLRTAGITWDVDVYKKELSDLKRWKKKQNRKS